MVRHEEHRHGLFPQPGQAARTTGLKADAEPESRPIPSPRQPLQRGQAERTPAFRRPAGTAPGRPRPMPFRGVHIVRRGPQACPSPFSCECGDSRAGRQRVRSLCRHPSGCGGNRRPEASVHECASSRLPARGRRSPAERRRGLRQTRRRVLRQQPAEAGRAAHPSPKFWTGLETEPRNRRQGRRAALREAPFPSDIAGRLG